jgi:PIN domain nuclease of toxin-antitoxin system
MGGDEVILLDTHIWFWWVRADPQLTVAQAAHIAAHAAGGLGVNVISVWELAMLEQKGRVSVDRPLSNWVRDALAYPNVQFLPLTTEIAIESTRLPGPFHKDPADRILVGTARLMAIPLLTEDRKILAYPHVTCSP